MADPETPESTEPAFDMDAAVESIGSSLFSNSQASEDEAEQTEPEAGAEPSEKPAAAAPAPDTTAEPEAPQARPAPKSWAKEKHEVWAKMPPEAQDYYLQREQQMHEGISAYKGDAEFGKQLKSVFEPYRPMLQAAGASEVQAVKFLLDAHARLSTAPAPEKAALFAKLAQDYGIDLSGVAQQVASPADPHIKSLQDRLDMLQSTITTREQAALQEAQQKVMMEVEAFSKDPANAYFDDVADDIATIIRGAPGTTLKDAYEKAIWANPVTRAKEQAKQTAELEKKLRENARLDALKASKAASTTVRSRDTRSTPTEPLGTMDDTMRSALAAIKSRAH